MIGKYITEPSKRQKYEFNYDLFSVIDTEEKSYWLGFITADAYVNHNTLDIALKAEDVNHLIAFRKIFIGNVPNIKYKADTNAYRFSVYSVELCQDLADKGCIRGKLLRMFPNDTQVPNHLIHHYMRGYFDGDGSIYIDSNSNLRFSVIGSNHFLDCYEKILLEHCTRQITTKRRSQSKIGSDCQEIRYGGNKRCHDIYNFL